MIKFTKMQGIGNDFIIIEADSWVEANKFQPYAAFLCQRNYGVGADGLLVIGQDETEDIFMRIFNPDGSEPEMCGNGIRCAVRYAYEQRLAQDTDITVRTLAGRRLTRVNLVNNEVSSVRVDMGQPILTPDLIPFRNEDNQVSIQIDGNSLNVTAVSMGNPHAVILVDDVDQVPLAHWGSQIETHELFPAKTNVEFVQIIRPDEAKMRVWERGAGITLACGTGACASLVAGVINQGLQRSATIRLAGGDLFIEWDETDNHVYMTGMASPVFIGAIKIK